MKVRFTLTMDDIIINEKRLDNIVLDWEDDVDQEEVL